MLPGTWCRSIRRNRAGLVTPWFKTKLHHVDALTDVDGCPAPAYLERHWEHPDALDLKRVDLYAIDPDIEDDSWTVSENDLRAWLNRRLEDMLVAPRMWGSPESVELQTLRIVELRALIRNPVRARRNPRDVLEQDEAFLRARYPGRLGAPLLAPNPVVAGTNQELSALSRQASPQDFQLTADG